MFNTKEHGGIFHGSEAHDQAQPTLSFGPNGAGWTGFCAAGHTVEINLSWLEVLLLSKHLPVRAQCPCTMEIKITAVNQAELVRAFEDALKSDEASASLCLEIERLYARDKLYSRTRELLLRSASALHAEQELQALGFLRDALELDK